MPDNQFNQNSDYEKAKLRQEQLREKWIAGGGKLEEEQGEPPEETEELPEPDAFNEPDFLDAAGQQVAANEMGRMKKMENGETKENTEPNIIGGVGEKIGEQAVKKMTQAAWKKFALWFAATIGPYLLGTLIILLVVFMVVAVVLAYKCEIDQVLGPLKFLVSWFGINCPVASTE
jgi:hypothetical protein